MKSFRNKLAVVTGGGSGMGRELVRQLAAEGCHIATCDVSAENLADTKEMCPDAGVRITTHICDVSDERQVIAFRDAVKAQHQTDRLNVLFNNAGIGGGGSFLKESRTDWEKTFGVCWYGVYYCCRAFLPMVVASDEGSIVNTSSVNGFWACLGPSTAHTAYSAAKFAVKGFTEALMIDMRLNAPHVKVSVVMPGHIGTSIFDNTNRVLGKPGPLEMRAEDVALLRDQLVKRGMPVADAPDDDIRAIMHQLSISFREAAPTSAAAAATIILDGVRAEKWRILVGADAHTLDRLVRESPETAYEQSLIQAMRAEGHMGWLD